MSLSSLSRALTRSARSSRSHQGPLLGGNGGFRAPPPPPPLLPGGSGGMGFSRGYLTSALGSRAVTVNGAGKVGDLRYLLASSHFQRPLSDQSNKNYEKDCPKEGEKKKKPEGDGSEKSDSKKESSKDKFFKLFQDVSVIILGLFLVSLSFGSSDEEISFQEFENKLLKSGLVDHIVVSNKSVAKVYVRSKDIDVTTSNVPGEEDPSRYKYYINIGSVDSFEEKLQEAQKALGIDRHDDVPVTYAAELNWFKEILSYAPTFLILVLIYMVGKRMKNGFSIGGDPRNGGHSIFNIGKAQVTRVDPNFKNKVLFKDVAGCDETKQEIMEFVHFLKTPKKYEELGAKIPKGALLVGPPAQERLSLLKLLLESLVYPSCLFRVQTSWKCLLALDHPG